MTSKLDRREMVKSNNESSYDDETEKELGLLIRERSREGFDDFDDHHEELNIYRSGSAPPTVEGSLSVLGYAGGSDFQELARNRGGNNGFKSEEQSRSDPNYLSYYYSNVNLNPRLPPPLLSKEDWRSNRLQGSSSSAAVGGDRRMVNWGENARSRSLLSNPPGFGSKKQDIASGSGNVHGSVEWGGDGLIGLPGLGLGTKQKSSAEFFQGDFAPSRPISRNAFDHGIDNLGSAESDLSNLRSGLISNDLLRSSSNIGGQHGSQPVSYSYAAALGGGSLSRSTTLDPQAIARAQSPGLAPIGGGRTSRNTITSPNSSNGLLSESTELAGALAGMNIASNVVGQEENRFPSRIEQEIDENSLFNLSGNQQHSGYNCYRKGSSSASASASVLNNGGGGGFQSQYHHMDSPNSLIPGYNLTGYPVNQLNLPPLFENAAAASANGIDQRMLRVPGMIYSPVTEQNLPMAAASGLQSPYRDSAYHQYPAGHIGSFNVPSMDPLYTSNYHSELLHQKAYLEGMQQSPQKANFGGGGGGLGGTGATDHSGFYGIPGYGSYPQSQLVGHNSPVGPSTSMRRHSGDFSMRYASGMINVAGGSGGVFGPQLDNLDKNFASGLLEEFKSNKTKCFDLFDIAGHVVEFSQDQHGSRFIQQKLETATEEEKTMVYNEINPYALTLMTDVFGNYVIQKFFEHGMVLQKRELARKLTGNVLSMSLQMYGCRVIQKAIEVADEDQKIQMVKELHGQIMRCVHDQNGNHVIQKCIECIPEEHIHFIVSTIFGQVVALSSHLYGCRIIQRVLEHCRNPDTQSKVMDEILPSVSKLTQDQYGNYVIQHVIEHGKPNERSKIIHELAPKIVEMSQQKYASNVVERCLKHGNPNEVQLLVNEMLGTTDENEPLQAMMKDQFANYVVQKVLETCSDHQRDLIMSRIKVHLNALKKYTYGKHIVSRVEKLLDAGGITNFFMNFNDLVYNDEQPGSSDIGLGPTCNKKCQKQHI